MRQSQKYGIIGTIIFLILLFLLLWFVYIAPIEEPQEDIVEIELSDVIEDAGGFKTYNPSPETTPQPAVAEPVPNQPVKSEAPAEPVITQEDEEALAMLKQKEKEERERKERERLEAERLAAEKAAAEKAAAEKAAAEQAAKDKANALMGGAFKGAGQGGTGGQTIGGSGGGDNPIKNGMSGGNGWTAKGRTLKGQIPKPAISDFPEGKVVVTFRIDASGKVSSPRVAQGTTISEKAVQNACLNAAKQATFTGGIDEVEGTITFNFKVN